MYAEEAAGEAEVIAEITCILPYAIPTTLPKVWSCFFGPNECFREPSSMQPLSISVGIFAMLGACSTSIKFVRLIYDTP